MLSSVILVTTKMYLFLVHLGTSWYILVKNEEKALNWLKIQVFVTLGPSNKGWGQGNDTLLDEYKRG